MESCAVGPVYLDAAFIGKVRAASVMEASILDFAEGVEPNARPSCQIKVRTRYIRPAGDDAGEPALRVEASKDRGTHTRFRRAKPWKLNPRFA